MLAPIKAIDCIASPVFLGMPDDTQSIADDEQQWVAGIVVVVELCHTFPFRQIVGWTADDEDVGIVLGLMPRRIAKRNVVITTEPRGSGKAVVPTVVPNRANV